MSTHISKTFPPSKHMKVWNNWTLINSQERIMSNNFRHVLIPEILSQLHYWTRSCLRCPQLAHNFQDMKAKSAGSRRYRRSGGTQMIYISSLVHISAVLEARQDKSTRTQVPSEWGVWVRRSNFDPLSLIPPSSRGWGGHKNRSLDINQSFCVAQPIT